MATVENHIPSGKRPSGKRRATPTLPPRGAKGGSRRLCHLLGLFARDRRGVIAIMLGLMFPVLLGFIGLGVEVGMWYEDRRDLQTAADAAAIAGAYELKDGGTEASVQTVATAEAVRNNGNIVAGDVTPSTPPTAGAYTADPSAVEVNITSTVSLMFSEFFLDNDITINARAVAVSIASGDEACVLALDDAAQRAINVSGTAQVSMDGCFVASNSTAANAINVSGSAGLEVDCGSTAGGVSGDVTTTACGGVNTGVRAIEDPFEDLEVPGFAGCDATAYTAANGETIAPDGGDTKVFCDGLTINAGDTVHFDPGVYIINEGSLKINGGANVTGDGVTFIFTGSGIVDWADASVNGGGSVELSAPTDESSDWQGILFFQDVDSATNSSNAFTFNGGSETELTGAIYVPNNDVVFSGGNDLDDNGCLLIVARTVTFNGNADFENECDGIIPNPIYTSYTIRLVE